jgi:two-component system phosphate regulon sensor histidine kinase PhoR
VYEYLKKEIVRFVILLLLILALGLLSGQWFLAVLVVYCGYMIWHLRQLYFLERWLLGLDEQGSGQMSGIWLYLTDSVKRYQKSGRKRKRRISRLLQRFNTTLELIPDAIVVTNANWQIEWVNAASQRLLGVSRRSIGSSLEKLFAPEVLDIFKQAPDKSLPFEMISPVTGNVELEVKITPFSKDQLLITAHDITELKKVESIRREFLANVSHELRTPLTVISGYLEMMESEDWPEHYREAVRASSRQAQRMQLLVSDLLMLSKLEMHENAPLIEDVVDVGHMLAGLKSDAVSLSDTSKHKLQLQVEDNLKMRGNEAELSSAFGNLIFNAVLHTPPGSKIIIGWHHKADMLEFSVSDNGPGIEAKHLARLTERFYRVDKARSREKGGTGLGLSITRHVVSRHGGEIKIESELGRGTTFRCLFPMERKVG